jgi:hypothetical protein
VQNYRIITMKLPKLQQNHRERRTKFLETKYFYSALGRGGVDWVGVVWAGLGFVRVW